MVSRREVGIRFGGFDAQHRGTSRFEPIFFSLCPTRSYSIPLLPQLLTAGESLDINLEPEAGGQVRLEQIPETSSGKLRWRHMRYTSSDIEKLIRENEAEDPTARAESDVFGGCGDLFAVCLRCPVAEI